MIYEGARSFPISRSIEMWHDWRQQCVPHLAYFSISGLSSEEEYVVAVYVHDDKKTIKK